MKRTVGSGSGGRIRVLHVITDLQTGGAEVMLAKLLATLDPARFESRVISLRAGGEVAPRIRALGVEVLSPRMNPGLPGPAAVARLAILARGWRADAVQGWMYHGNLAALLCRCLMPGRPRLLWNVRGTNTLLAAEKLGSRITIWLGARVSHIPDRIVYNSEASARSLESDLGYPAASRRIIPNGFDAAAFRPDDEARAAVRRQNGIPLDTPLVGLIGRHHPVKDHGLFLEAAARVSSSFPDVRFLLAGKGVDPANPFFREKMQAPGLAGRVHLLGERADMPAVQAALDVACCSSRSENFPNALGEAMACGVPCVSTDVGDCAKLLGPTGLIVAPGDAEALAGAVGRLLAMPGSARRELGARARARVMELFDLGSVAGEYAGLYEGTISEVRACAE